MATNGKAEMEVQSSEPATKSKLSDACMEANKNAKMKGKEIVDCVETHDHHDMERGTLEFGSTFGLKMLTLEERLSRVSLWEGLYLIDNYSYPSISGSVESSELSTESSLSDSSMEASVEAVKEAREITEHVEGHSDHDLARWTLNAGNETLDVETHRLKEIVSRVSLWEGPYSGVNVLKLCTKQRAPHRILWPDEGQSSLEIARSPIHETQQSKLASVSRNINDNSVDNGDFFLKSQEANNISKAAYKEIVTKALEAKTWVLESPALGSLEEIVEMFRHPPPCGMRVECSIETAVVQVPPEILVSIMMDVDWWALSLSQIVYRARGHDPTGVLQQLKNMDKKIGRVTMVDAEVRLPTPLVQTLKFRFLRYQKLIIPDIWAIVDISSDYFQHKPADPALEGICRRRPSGVIIRRCDIQWSEVIWIENMEMCHRQIENSIHSSVVNSSLEFCAKHWVTTLSQKLKRNYESRFVKAKMFMGGQAHNALLRLAEVMQMVFLECVHECPDKRKWIILSDEGIRILKDVTGDYTDTFGSDNYIAVTSFRVQANPIAVFEYLVEKNIELLCPSFLNLEEPEEVNKLVSDDDSNQITVHKRLVSEYEYTQIYEYILQEASRNEYCSFVVSTIMSQLEAVEALDRGRWRDVSLQPVGFAIMPDGSGGRQSDSSLVTMVLHILVDVSETDKVLKLMTQLVTDTMREIREEVIQGSEEDIKET